MHTAFVNAYLDWHNSSAFTPYVGGGLGAAFLKGRATATFYGTHSFIDTSNPSKPVASQGGNGRFNYEKRKTQFAWHLDLGFSYDLTEKMALDLSYRYLDIGDHLKVAKEPFINKRPYSECIFTGPSEIKFEPTHQVVLGVRYSF